MTKTSLFLGLGFPYIARCRTLGLHLVQVIYLMQIPSLPASKVNNLKTFEKDVRDQHQMLVQIFRASTTLYSLIK